MTIAYEQFAYAHWKSPLFGDHSASQPAPDRSSRKLLFPNKIVNKTHLIRS